jgi:prevent-host-death family protein
MEQAITASEANQRFSEMLRSVRLGGKFVVTSRGRPVARVIPVEPGEGSAAFDGLLDYLGALPRRSAGDWQRSDLYE